MRDLRPLSMLLASLLALQWIGCLGLSDPSEPDEPARRPNVLLISIDTLRADHLGIYGYERNTSPFLDQLAREGLFVPEPVTVTHGTTPSHASMLTSVPQEVHGVALDGQNDDVIPPSLPNLPEVFRDAGYATIAVTGGGNIGRKFGFDRGFDVFDDRARGVESGRSLLLQHLAEVPADQPVMALFHTYEVHTPYVVPDDLSGHFGATDGKVATTSESLVGLANNAADLSEDDLAHIRARYDEGILHTDRVIRQLFEELTSMGRLDDAIVVITSDHGEEFGEHGGLVHRDLLYEELVHVPMIFWGSRVPPFAAAPQTATTLDLAPTLTHCAGLTAPSSWKGRDLLCSEAEGGERAHIVQYADRRYGVRTDRWKLIVTRLEGDNHFELFDLDEDPREQHNLASDRPEVVSELVGHLRKWQASVETVDSRAGSVELNDEEREHLESLGYLGGA